MAFSVFPREFWREIWSNNPQERLNKEIQRHADLVGIFPNHAALGDRFGFQSGAARRAPTR